MPNITEFIFTVLAITYGPMICALLLLVIVMIMGERHVRPGQSKADRG